MHQPKRCSWAFAGAREDLLEVGVLLFDHYELDRYACIC